MRQVHQRGYNDFYDVPAWLHHEINGALANCKSVKGYAEIFKDNEEYLTDFQIAYAFEDIADNGLLITSEFWTVILPKVREQVLTLDRQCTASLMNIIAGAGQMQLQDNQLWEALESKLVDEGLLRYFSIHQQSEILFYFARCGRGSDELIDQLEKIFIKHRKALLNMPDTLHYCKEGFGLLSKGSEILKRVLENPAIDLPKLA
uniref:Uncharacterized protein n=1 Tax=Strombidium rassoulzadegani TaxID=1082188 RepID=A0A7S3FUP7_9SPIT|mmetsp:Transcript_17765/g.30078  ORF Transcript_17765/g.30078 Transcript_17765/m.30078 type:complete len:204 (+) Transcript_17765:145-756(+)